MLVHREYLYDPTPSAFKESERYANLFFHKPHVREGLDDNFTRQLWRVSYPQLDDVHVWDVRWRQEGIGGVKWSMLNPDSFRVDPTDLEGVVKDNVKPTTIDLWSRSVDSSYDAKEKSSMELQAEVSACKSILAPVARVHGQESDFVDAVADAVSRNDIVIAHAPPGYGKSAQAPLIAKVVHLIDANKRTSGPPGDVIRGDITRQPSQMTKVLHVVPTETNAMSIVNFLANKFRDQAHTRIRAVTTDSRMSEDDRATGVDYVITTYSTAEKLLRLGRFKMVILDEAHLPMAEITSSVLRTLEAMTRPPSTSLISFAEYEGPRRVDKLLILNGIRASTSVDYFDSLFGSEEIRRGIHLSVAKIQRPINDADWEKRRFVVRSNHLMGVDTIRNLDLPVLDIMFAKRVNKTEAEIYNEDLAFTFKNFCNKIPDFLLERLQCAAEAAILLHTREAEEHRDSEAEKKATQGQRYKAPAPFQYSFIIIFVPSSACAKLVYQRIKYSDINKMHPVRGSPLFIEPYSIHIANETMSVEKCLTAQYEADADVKRPRASDDNRIPSSVNYKQGKILICVNGVELGLTIPKVAVVIESGVERISDGYSRTGVDRYFFAYTDQTLFEQRLGRAGRVRSGLHLTVLGAEKTEWISSNGARLSAWKALDATDQSQFIRLIEDPCIRDSPAFRTRMHMESLTEARVKATIGDVEETLKNVPTMAFTLNHCTLHDINAYPFMDPFDVRLLRAYISCNLVVHGAMCVALRTHKRTALRKPIGGDTSRVGPTTEINSLDLFKSGMLSIPHIHPNGSERALINWTSDTVPMVEMHVQLLIASGWDPRKPVPSKAELLGSAAPHPSNFWHGGWTPCGPVRQFPLLRQRLDPSLAGINPPLKNDFAFLYGYLITDEERRELWAIFRQIILCLREDNMLHYPIDQLLKTGPFNMDVYNMETAPVLNARGRRTMEFLETVFCTRFANPSPGTRSYDGEGAGKKRGIFKDWYRDDPKFDNPIINPRYILRTVRAESGWKVDPKSYPLFRFGPSSVPVDYSDNGPDACFIAPMDPVTNMQAFLFANAAGKWRIVEDRQEGSCAYTYALEIECNGCNALVGLKFMIGNKDHADALGHFRMWLYKYLGQFTEDCNMDDNFAKCINQIHLIWEMHQPEMNKHQKQNPRNADLNPAYSLLW